jgi:hypothetical protein
LFGSVAAESVQAPLNFLHHTAWEVDDIDEVGRVRARSSKSAAAAILAGVLTQ